MRQEPSDPDFEPFPIWSKKLDSDFNYPQLLFTYSPLTFFYVIWAFGVGTNIPLPSPNKTSILGQNIDSFSDWLRIFILPRIKTLYNESNLLEKIFWGLIGGISAGLIYQIAKDHPQFSMNIVLGMLGYIQIPFTERNENNPIYLRNLTESGIINVII